MPFVHGGATRKDWDKANILSQSVSVENYAFYAISWGDAYYIATLFRKELYTQFPETFEPNAHENLHVPVDDLFLDRHGKLHHLTAEDKSQLRLVKLPEDQLTSGNLGRFWWKNKNDLLSDWQKPDLLGWHLAEMAYHGHDHLLTDYAKKMADVSVSLISLYQQMNTALQPILTDSEGRPIGRTSSAIPAVSDTNSAEVLTALRADYVKVGDAIRAIASSLQKITPTLINRYRTMSTTQEEIKDRLDFGMGVLGNSDIHHFEARKKTGTNLRLSDNPANHIVPLIPQDVFA